MYRLGAVSLYLANKVEDVQLICPRKVMDVCNLFGRTSAEFLAEERLMLAALQFDVLQPTALDFLRRFSKAYSLTSRRTHLLAKYLIELGLLSHECAAWLPSLLAASALYAATQTILRAQFVWTGDMPFYTGYDEHQLRAPADRLRSLASPHQITHLTVGGSLPSLATSCNPAWNTGN